MNRIVTRTALILALVGGSAALVGCDETISKESETKVRSDGSTRTETETVKQRDDGTVVKQEEVKKTAPTKVD